MNAIIIQDKLNHSDNFLRLQDPQKGVLITRVGSSDSESDEGIYREQDLTKMGDIL